MNGLAQRRRRCGAVGLTVAGLIVSAACGTEDRTEDGPGHEGVHGGVEFTGGGHHTLLVTDDFPPPGEPDLVLRVGRGPLPHKKNSPYEHAYRIKLNANSLKGVADVKLPCDVHESGYVSVCSGPDVAEVLKHGRTWGIRVAANDETEVGETGEITVTAFGENYVMWPDGPPPVRFTLDVSSGLEPTGRANTEGVEAGDTYRTRMGFTNEMPRPADGVVLRYVGTVGLSFPERYRNCSYGRKRLEKDGEQEEFRVAVCRFDGPFPPGTAYRLAEPVAVRAADYALHEHLDYRFYPRRHREVPALDEGGSFRQGEGAHLTLEPAPAETDEQPEPWRDAPMVQNRTYDLSLTGEWTSAAADDTATEVRLVLGDRGPARFAGSPTPARGSVIPSHGAVVVMKPPEGTTVTGIPDGCTAVDKGFRKIDQDHKWFHTFACPIEAGLLPGETVELRFRLSGGETAPGEEIRAKIRFGYMFPDRLETEPANNRITLRLDGAGSAGTPG